MRISIEEHAKLTSYSIHQLADLKQITERLQVSLQHKGKFDDEDVATLALVSDNLKKMRTLNILVGYLGGLSGKKLAKIHGVTPSRISQIISAAKAGKIDWLKPEDENAQTLP